MSFRELRSFAETMRLLGYHNLISMESFRTPNVELVADCLYWLIKRYEPSAEVVYNIEREADRVFFFKQICEAALTKARIKLNIKKLYQCDGHAVQEMLKLANVLKKAMKATDGEEPDFTALQQMAAQKNVHEAKTVQQLCSDLTNDGSSLFFMVEEEMQTRGDRQHVLSRATEVGEFERRLRELLTSVGQQVGQLQQSITNLSADETNLEQKIENKKTQLERAQKRYRSLMAVRPAYVEEYDKHESELQAQFVKYLEQYRNLEYLEFQLAKFNAKEDAMLKEQQVALGVMRERLRKEELQTLRNGSSKRGAQHPQQRGNQPAYEDEDEDDDDDESDGAGYTGNGGVRARNAAEDGSSVSSSGNGSGTDNDHDGDERGGRTGPSPSAELSKRQQHGFGNIGGNIASSNGGGGGGGAGAVGRPPMPGGGGGRSGGNFHTADESEDDSTSTSDDTSNYSDDSSDVSTSDDDDDSMSRDDNDI